MSVSLSFARSSLRTRIGIEPSLLTGPCVVWVDAGPVFASDGEGERVDLHDGDLLTITPSGRCRLDARSDRAELLIFDVGRDWASGALELAECEGWLDGVPFFVDRAGTDTARRGRRLLHDLDRMPESAGSGDRLRSTARRLDLLALAFESRPEVLRGMRRAGQRRRERFREAVAALEASALDELSLAGFARHIGLSERQVSRLFREEMGTTFREHVTALRVDRAKSLLADTEIPVIEVAGETGWSSLAHFNMVFRRRVGLTPSEFRRTRLCET